MLWPDLLHRFCELPLLEEEKKWDVSNSGAAEIWRAAVFISEIWQNCSVRCRVLQGFPNTPSLALTLSARLGSQTDLEITLNLRSLPLKSSQLSPPSFTTCYFVFMCLNLSVKLFNSPVDSSLKMFFWFYSTLHLFISSSFLLTQKARCTARPWRPPMTPRTGCPCPPRACGSERTPWPTACQTCRPPS